MSRPPSEAQAQGGGEASEGWHAALDSASELVSNAPDARYRKRAEQVRDWIKAHPAAPPSAPVGVPYKQETDYADGLYGPDDLAAIWNACVNAHKTLAQQPSAAPVEVEELVETWGKRAGELNDEGLYGCCAETYEQCAAQVRALAQQPAAVDEAMVARFLEAYRDTPGDEAIDADEKVVRRWLTFALAVQQGGAK